MPKILEDIGCPYCGCSCDDVRVVVSDDGKKILEVENACAIGTEIFLQATSSDRITRPRLRQPDGSWKEISYEEAFDYAAKAIIAAKKPLMYGFGSTTCEAQREAARLMEIGCGILDNCASICHGPSLIAHFDNGYPSCTLGEVKNRADVILYWGANPIHAHPRHMSRYAIYPLGFFKGNGFVERTVIVVDPRKTDTAGIADYHLQVKPGHDYELFNAFRMVMYGHEKDIPENVAEIPKQTILEVAGILKQAKFGVFFFGMGLTHTDGRNHNIDIAISLTRDLNQISKWSIMAMRGHFNVAGANRVWCWSYGFPYCLDLTKGDHAHMNPGETSTIDLANRDEIDLFINIGTDAAAHFPIDAVRHLKKHTWITIDPNMSMAAEVADLHIPVGISGVEVPGIVYRMDNVPIQYRKVVDMPEGMLSDEEVLSGIADRIEVLLQEQISGINKCNDEVTVHCN
ncbi:MAG: formylmethanofuran dehydrogenase subunit B [Methanomicrobiales archaeon]|nr:formylmethanofuran dehydrogenase subunit B [Methanomicrobiales archaeon]